jgi:4'-phosphopantetheinyl transferase
MSAVIRICAAQLPPELDPEWLRRLSEALPPAMHEEALRFVQPVDQARYSLGRHLISRLVAGQTRPADGLQGWRADHYGRPSLPGLPPFNLTHSGQLVALCWRERPEGAALGLDVERIRPLDLELFGPYMSGEEWDRIAASPEPMELFFHYWTAKEAVMKAEGLGFHLPIEQIALQGHLARVEGRIWHLHPLDLASGYAAHLACPEAEPQLKVEHWDAGALST